MATAAELLSDAALAFTHARFILSQHSNNGPQHWYAVTEIGRFLAARSLNVDPQVVELFAVLPDHGRMNEFHDPEHGARAADVLLDRLALVAELTEQQRSDLEYAIRWHNDAHAIATNTTVAACWSADRFQLLRLGIEPRLELLPLTEAHSAEAVTFSRQIAQIETPPQGRRRAGDAISSGVETR